MEDGEDEADAMMAAINKLLTQPTNAEERQFIRTAKTYIAKQGGPRAFLQRSVIGTSTTLGRNGPVGGGAFLLAAPVQLPPIPPFTYNDKNTRGLLTKLGFDPDNLNKRNEQLWNPICYFSAKGNITMVRYLITRDADCRQTNQYGCFPMYQAACNGHLDVMQLLFHESGTPEDIRKVARGDYSPMYIALVRGHFNVVYWLILIGALAPRNDVDGGGIDDATMRRDLRQDQENDDWSYDHRETVLTWAQTSVANHDNVVKVLLTGMILRSNQTLSPLVVFKGTSGILELIADYVAGTKHQLRTLRQLIDRLLDFIAEVPFVDRHEDEDVDVDEDEDDY